MKKLHPSGTSREGYVQATIGKISEIFSLACLLWLAVITPAQAALINDFNLWTQVQDPAHSGMTGSIDSSTQATLTTSGAVPAGTDIGYQSVNANSVAGSSSGYYFPVDQDFHIAVDFDVSAVGSIGFAGIGFGIGEDGAGENSAGAGLAINNGSPLAFSGAARINDTPQAPIPLGLTATSSGRFFVGYDSATGDVTFGVSAVQGSNTPSHTGTFASLQNSWQGDDLLVSFFLRSDTQSIFPALSAGSLEAVFSNFEVLEGTPVAVVPLPAAVWLFGCGLLGLIGLARKKA